MNRILFTCWIALLLVPMLVISCDDDPDENPYSINSFHLVQSGPYLKFYYQSSGSIFKYELAVKESDNAISPEDAHRFIFNNLDSVQYSIDYLNLFASEDYDFYLRAIGSDLGKSVWFGPVNLTIESYCESPYNLSFGAGLSWETYYNQTESTLFEVEYGENGFLPGSGTKILTSNHTTYDFILEMGTLYDFYVKGYCSGNLGWSAVEGPFTYLSSANFNLCMEPENVGWSIERNFFGEPVGATFTWIDNGNNPSYEFNLVGDGYDPESNAVESGSSTTITYLSMYQDTDYDFYVRTICVDGTKTGWIGPLSLNIGH